MGWTVHYRWNSPKTHAEEKREILSLFASSNPDVTYTPLQVSKVGSTWYVATKIEGRPDVETHIPDESGAYVVCIVILTSKAGGEWGYKDLDECSGPTESRAPKSLLAKLSPLAPPPAEGPDRAEYARAWRARCMEYADRLKPKVGDVLTLAESVPFTGQDGARVDVDRVTVTSYTRRGRQRIVYHHPQVGLLRLRPSHLTGAKRA